MMAGDWTLGRHSLTVQHARPISSPVDHPRTPRKEIEAEETSTVPLGNPQLNPSIYIQALG